MMSGRAIADTVVAHIGHAERWLRRARTDYERGDLRQVVLRLLLAEAEIRRARESGTAIAELPPRRTGQVSWAVLGAAAAAALILAWYALTQLAAGPVAPDQILGGHARSRLNSIVRFDSGQVLPFVEVPVRPSDTPAGSTGVDLDRLVTFSDEGPVLVTSR
jgi:hypothetical protein